MAFDKSLWVHGDGTLEYSARDFRRLVEAIARPGVFRPETGALRVSERAAGASLSVDVAAGQCAVEGTSQAQQGNYLCSNDAVVNVPVSPPPSANARIDLVVVRMPAVESGPPAPEIVAGAAAATPMAPAVPDDALLLAEILVDSADVAVADAMITDRRVDAMRSPGRIVDAQQFTDSIDLPDTFTRAVVYSVDLGGLNVAPGSTLLLQSNLIVDKDGGGEVAHDYRLDATSITGTAVALYPVADDIGQVGWAALLPSMPSSGLLDLRVGVGNGSAELLRGAFTLFEL